VKIIIDTATRNLTTVDGELEQNCDLYSQTAFETISLQWVRVGWSLGYYNTFRWLGHPVLQMPEDLIRLQEVIYRVRPDVIVETGVFQGGSLMFHATLCQALGTGRVIGIDNHIEYGVRKAIGEHLLAPRISLVEGDSTSGDVVDTVAGMILPSESVLVILDSCHTKDHVKRELECYSRLVTAGSYIIAADGIMRDLADVPGGQAEWISDNPLAAADEFAAIHPEFRRPRPGQSSRNGDIAQHVTYWPGAWLERVA
jgi:cephalosporin hydroxylase